MEKQEQIKKAFESLEDKEKASQMSKYMRDKFPFYGISTPERKKAYKDFLKEERKNGAIDWYFLGECWIKGEQREYQYFVCDYLIAMKKYLTYENIDIIKNFVIIKPWWDTIDSLCKLIGYIELKDERVKELMLKWSKSENIWVRRTAIEHQLCLKDKTDTNLLEQIIVNCLGSKEFFINKAIGWALREYSKTDSCWVKDFIEKYKDKMSRLSIREASKYIK